MPDRNTTADLLAARAALLRRQRDILRRVEQDLADWRASVGRTLARYRGVQPDLVRLADTLDDLGASLHGALASAIRSHRRFTIADMLRIWTDLGDREASRLALRITDAALYTRLRDGVTFQTALQTATGNASREIIELVAEAVRLGQSPRDLSTALLKYLDGAERIPIPTVGYLDLRRVPGPLRGEARFLRFKAERIAVTELSIARAESELIAFTNNPAIGAIQWRLSPNRGSTRIPDICDVLATVNAFDLGPGVYPIDRVPPIPHPFCRCSRRPIDMPRQPGQRPAHIDLWVVDGFDLLPPGAKRKLAEQYGTAMGDAERSSALVEGFQSTSA